MADYVVVVGAGGGGGCGQGTRHTRGYTETIRKKRRLVVGEQDARRGDGDTESQDQRQAKPEGPSLRVTCHFLDSAPQKSNTIWITNLIYNKAR